EVLEKAIPRVPREDAGAEVERGPQGLLAQKACHLVVEEHRVAVGQQRADDLNVVDHAPARWPDLSCPRLPRERGVEHAADLHVGNVVERLRLEELDRLRPQLLVRYAFGMEDVVDRLDQPADARRQENLEVDDALFDRLFPTASLGDIDLEQGPPECLELS